MARMNSQANLARPLIVGQKGGEEQRSPIEAPDTLRSVAVARILDLISEGEIRGLVDGMRSVFINETPLENADGTLNFKNVLVDYRSGTQYQSHIPGFPAAENESAVGVELKFDTPWTRTFTNTSLSAIRVRLSVPQLTSTNTKNGDINGSKVAYQIRLAVDDGPFQNVVYGSMVGKTTSKFERSHRIDLPRAESSWTIRVVRFTPDSTTATESNRSFIEAFTEVIDAKLRYPNSALVGIAMDAEQFSGIPTRAYDMYGRIIRVPSNYDPETRTYSGIWDGTFKPAYSNNPAWVFYDIVTQKRFGLGHLIDGSLVDKWGLYTIAKYCDQMVPDGRGGFEPRFECNVYLQTRQEAFKVLQDLASAFRGLSYWSSGAIVASADMPQDEAFIYNSSNVIDGKFAYQGTAKKTRYTAALVSWNDMTDFGRAKVEYVEDPEGIARYGLQQAETTAVGCTSQAMARRLGRWIILSSRYETDTVTFKVGLDGTLCMPGQIIMVADPARAGRRIGGRISAATLDSVTVDSAPAVSPGDTISVVSPSATTVTKTVASVSGRTITISGSFGFVPERDSAWTVESSSLKAQRFRIVQVDDNEDNTFTITAIEHNQSKYDHIENGIKLDEPPIRDIPGVGSNVIAAPTNLTLTVRDVVTQNTAQKVATFAWDSTYGAVGYEPRWRQNSGSWISGGVITGTSIDIVDLVPGDIEVMVAAVSAFNSWSQFASAGPFPVDPVATPPGYVEDIVEQIEQETVDRALEDLANAQAIAQEVLDRTADTANLIGQINQEVQDRAQADLDLAEDISEAAQAANARADAQQAQLDVISAQVADIYGADVHDPDREPPYGEGDIVQDGGEPAKLYRATQDVPVGTALTDATYWEFMGNYASLGEATAANLALTTTAINELAAVSQTVTDHSARMPSGNGKLATEAQITSVTNAMASGDAALASDVSALAAKVGVGVIGPELVPDPFNSPYLFNVGLASMTVVDGALHCVAANGSDRAEWRLTDLEVGSEYEVKIVAKAGAQGTTQVITRAGFDPVSWPTSINIDETEFTEYVMRGVAMEVGPYVVRVYAASSGGAGGDEVVIQSFSVRKLNAGESLADALSGLTVRIEEAENGLEAIAQDVVDLNLEIADKASTSALTELLARVVTAEGVIDAMSSDVTDLKNAVNDPTTGVAATADALSTLQSRVTTAESGVLSLSGDVTDLKNTVNDPATGLVATNNALGSLVSRVVTAEDAVESHGSRLTNLESAIEDPETGLAATAGGLADLSTTVSQNGDTLSAVSADMVDLAAKVNDPETGLEAAGTALSVLQARVEDVEGELASIASDATELGSRMGTVESALINAVITSASNDAAHASAINQLQVEMTETLDEVEAFGTAISDFGTRVTAAEGMVASQGNDIVELQNTVNDPETGLGATATGLNNLLTRVVAAEGDLDSITQDMVDIWSAIHDTETGLQATAGAVSLLETNVSQRAKIYYQTTAPSSTGRVVGDIWFDSNDNNKQYTWSGTAWVPSSATGISVIAQASQPSTSGRTEGDIWIETDNNNKLWRWNGSSWVDASDGRISSQAQQLTELTSEINDPETGLAAAVSAISGLTTSLSSVDGRIETMEAKFFIQLDVNGKVAGIYSVNDGLLSQITFNFDNVDFVSSNGSVSLSNGIYSARAGGFMTVMGPGFGVGGRLVRWFGPVMSISSCSESNAIAYENTSGHVYVQSISSGTLTFANGVESMSSPLTLSLTVDDTNGNPKTITASYSFNTTQVVRYNNTVPTGSATLSLWRKIGAGSWTQLGTTKNITFSGNVWDMGDDWYEKDLVGSGNYTFTDSDTSLDDRVYEWRLTSRSNSLAPGYQSLSIQSKE